jgi:hypothetical protein
MAGDEIMATSLEHIREILRPGLFEMRCSYEAVRAQWERILLDDPFLQALPTVSLPVAIAAGAAAAIIRNPEVSRRGLFGGGT